MVFFFIVFVFLLPVVIAIMNTINSRKRGKKGVAAFFTTAVLSIFSFATIPLWNFSIYSHMLSQLYGIFASAFVCAITFSYFFVGGFSGWKSTNSKRKKIITAIIPLTVASVFIITMGFMIFDETNYEMHISRIENEQEWTMKVRAAQRLAAGRSPRAHEADTILRNALVTDCPDLESLLSRSNAEWDIYREHTGYNGIKRLFTDYKERLINSQKINNDDIIRIIRRLYEYNNYCHINDLNQLTLSNGSIPDYFFFNMPERISPDLSDASSNKPMRFDNNLKYIIVGGESYREDDMQIIVMDMSQLLPFEIMAESEEDIDVIIIITSYYDYVGTYSNYHTKAYNRTVNICAYDYNTGQLLGVLGQYLTEAPKTILDPPPTYYASYPQGGILQCINTFFEK